MVYLLKILFQILITLGLPFQGMRFLQASVIESHGYLKSSNCIINNHFSLKISDFSRSIFMSDMERLNRATEEARNERE